MKKLLTFALVLVLVGCSASVVPSRSDILKRYSRMEELNSKQEEISGALMVLMFEGVEFSESEKKALAEHATLLDVYSSALSTALANGDYSTYDRLLRSANSEANALMEALLKISERPPEPQGTAL